MNGSEKVENYEKIKDPENPWEAYVKAFKAAVDERANAQFENRDYWASLQQRAEEQNAWNAIRFSKDSSAPLPPITASDLLNRDCALEVLASDALGYPVLPGTVHKMAALMRSTRADGSYYNYPELIEVSGLPEEEIRRRLEDFRSRKEVPDDSKYKYLIVPEVDRKGDLTGPNKYMLIIVDQPKTAE